MVVYYFAELIYFKRRSLRLRNSIIQDGNDTLGMLVVPNRTGNPTIDARELELLRTIRAIISQGIVLHRTIVNLVSLKTYNENILDSLNDMGDTLVILDLNGFIKSMNKATCRRLDYREEELAGRHIMTDPEKSIGISVPSRAGAGEPLFTTDPAAANPARP